MTLTIWSQYPIAEEFYPLFDTVASVTDDLARANAVLAGGSEPYDGDFMDSAPKLAVISRTGIGYNNVDVSAATSRGIAVCNAPDAPTMSTAEHTIGLIFGVAKQLKWCEERLTHDAAMGDFKGSYQGLELYGQTLGLVGFGRIGRRVGEMATGIGMKVIAFDPFVEPLVMIDARVSPVESLEILLSRSDVVSLHLPLLPETSKLMNAELFAMMAVCVRANTLSVGPEGDSALRMADLFCRHSRQRISVLFTQIFRNSDGRTYRVAQDVLQGGFTWLERGIPDS